VYDVLKRAEEGRGEIYVKKKIKNPLWKKNCPQKSPMVFFNFREKMKKKIPISFIKSPAFLRAEQWLEPDETRWPPTNECK